MTSDEETHNSKVVDLEKLRNFVVHNFFIWMHLGFQICVWISQIWNSNFANDLDQKSYNIKVVDLEKLWNFVVQKFFIWIRLGPQTSNFISN